MDWNFKAPSWDMSVVDEDTTLPNIETTMDDESSRFGVYRTKGHFSVDLKLGQVGNSGSDDYVVPKSKDVAAAGVYKMASSSPSGPYKRARPASNGTLAVSCLVDGCNSDLSTCRDYHRRHKVCEQHSKTPEVTIGGLKQRFCQQCSRFHSLDQFDEGKRSCRKRLDGHNRRRRKPQPDPVPRSGSFLSNYQGTQLLPFSSPHVYSSTAMVSPAWSSGLVASCSDARLQNHNQHQQQVHLVDKQDFFLGSSASSSYKEGKQQQQQQQLAFLHGADNATTIFNSNQALLRTNPLSESDHHMVRTSNKMLCDSLVSTPIHDPPRALSLLSSSQAHTHDGNGLSQMVQQQQQQQPHTMCLMQPLGLSLRDNNNSLESMDRVLVPNGNGSDHCSSVYDSMGGSDGSQGNEAPHQLFPFQWE